MVCLIVTILVGVLTTVALRGAHAAPMTGDGSVIDPVDKPQAALVQRPEVSPFTEVLKSLEEIGKTDMAEKGKDLHQYLVISVFSAQEFRQSRSTIPVSRTKVIYNEKFDNLPAYFAEVDVHGEMQALHFDNTIDSYLGQLNMPVASKEQELPYVFVYSYYIPCAGLTHIHYSCAEELANLARVNIHKYKMVVGYSTTWSGTDLDMAKRYLKEGRIYSLINVTNGQDIQGPYRLMIDEFQIYQKHMLDCLKNHAKNTASEDHYVYIINKVTKYCTEAIPLYGYMTQYGKAKMNECLAKFVAKAKAELQYYLRYCSINTLPWKIRMMLGQPTSMCNAEWGRTPEGLSWIDLYSDIEEEGAVNFPPNVVPDNGKIRKLCGEEVVKVESRNREHRNLYAKVNLDNLRSDIKGTSKTRTRERPP